MIDRNHPAVEALGFEGFDHEGGTMHAWRCEYPDRYPGYCTCPEEAVAIVRDNLTADDLRNTPAGQALIREGIAAARNLEWMQPRMTPGSFSYQEGPLPLGTMTSRELADTEDD